MQEIAKGVGLFKLMMVLIETIFYLFLAGKKLLDHLTGSHGIEADCN
jgi:hypothetical protein